MFKRRSGMHDTSDWRWLPFKAVHCSSSNEWPAHLPMSPPPKNVHHSEEVSPHTSISVLVLIAILINRALILILCGRCCHRWRKQSTWSPICFIGLAYLSTHVLLSGKLALDSFHAEISSSRSEPCITLSSFICKDIVHGFRHYDLEAFRVWNFSE